MSCLGLGKLKKAKMQKANVAADSSDDEYVVVGNELEFEQEPSDVSSQRSATSSKGGPQKLFTTDEKTEDKLVGVIITISQGSSYDENFREVQPKTVPGERVSTYSLECCEVGKLHAYLASAEQVPPAPSTWFNIMEDIRAVTPDAVTFNWECCDGCSQNGFPLCGGIVGRRFGRAGRSSVRGGAASPTMQLMGLAVRRGFTVMCSDFSLKALIAEWSDEQLGPNPFIKLQDECDSQFQLEFHPRELQNEEVPQQLQVVGELCAEQGKAIVGAMGGTIVYTVNPSRAQTELYELKVLTVVSNRSGRRSNGIPDAMRCAVGDGDSAKYGAAGHVTLTYASGGQLLTSMGHWIELTRINTSLESVVQAVAKNFGAEERSKLNAEYRNLRSDGDREACVQKWSKAMVQQSVPTRMKCRTKY